MNSNDLKERVDLLEKKADEIQNLAIELIESASLIPDAYSPNEYSFDLLSEDLRNLQQDIITKYNTWYNSVFPLVRRYLPHQIDEFNKSYRREKDTVFTYDISRILELNVIFLDGDKRFIIEKFQEFFTYQKSQLLSLKNIDRSEIIENLSTLNQLEKSLVQNIYDYLLKNPTVFKAKSRSPSPQKKYEVKERDKFTCQICEKKFPEVELQIDHIFPFSLGGSNQKPNLMALCKDCNADKGNRLEYYKTSEGKNKLYLNIEDFVKNLSLIQNFGEWLKSASSSRKRSSKPEVNRGF
ncbi:MAG: HNH endonuclease [Promethearchaeota archaeon]